ncbi:MAG: hypothetical protein Q8L48_08110 [Archangium sp.]|nr:hypothetical protein [Archangium sp.]
MRHLKTDERLSRTRHTRQQDEYSLALLTRLPCELENALDGAVHARARGASNVRKSEILEEQPSGCDERREGRIFASEERGHGHGPTGSRAAELDKNGSELRRWHDPDAVDITPLGPFAAENENGDHRQSFAGIVILEKVARVGGHLVDVGVAQASRTLELDDDDAPVLENQNVGSSASLAGQRILENGRISSGWWVELKDLRPFPLEHIQLCRPGVLLLSRRIGHEGLKACLELGPRKCNEFREAPGPRAWVE